MASKFSNRGKPVAPQKPYQPTTEAAVLRAMPVFDSEYERDKRLRRLNHGIPEERLLRVLRQTDTKLTLEELKVMLARLQSGGSIEFGLFPTPFGSEQSWRKRR